VYTLGIAGLLVAYVAIALLLLSINLYSNWSWKIKAASILATTLLYIVSYISFPPLLGWPTGEIPPERFRLIAADVVQPDKASGEKGMVYLWLKDLDDLSGRTRPRAYALAYSDRLHEMIINAKSKLNKGMAQLGEFKLPNDSHVREIDTFKRTGQKAVNIEFYDLPDPLIPDK